ncbi:PIG-L family deacetylase [Fulvivirga kasyanovii]|uniref:PIG-L family deacetylase n=2 Tax=Fulvivirga kasyanovii TaxID=396812 RepID=A0ABW9RNY3_9BACT|nr:PIG-L family deacetylase [Fulvivirga kasyanovii]MTI25615.1 PIG-L family deacetylase [Fulvivirga kasyanovii]
MRKVYLLLLLCVVFTAEAQKPEKPNAAEILLKLKKLNFLGNALYVAAHPDDENTRLISYLSNERLANTAYLSLTRGDGGQNLVGAEIREALGVIRTQELLSARRIDGGQQYFSRANDFGYSKSADETQEIWNRDEVLSDVVWVYRNFRPDVIITRFPPDERAGHGHHTTSAIMAEEAIDLAADKSKYPEQLQYVNTWKPKRLYMNTGRWWSPEINADTPGVLTIDVGGYNPLLGKSYTEIAALSRSQHKSQGFGSSGSRGEQLEFLEYVAGEKAEKDIFEGIDTSWKRVKGGEKIGNIVEKTIAAYDPTRPAAIMPQLLEARSEISKLKDPYWKALKLGQVDELIKSVMGLYLEVVADDYSVTPGDKITLTVEAINRSVFSARLKQVKYNALADTVANLELAENKDITFKTTLDIPDDREYSKPYWLREEGTLGMYKVDDLHLIGTPENDPAIPVKFILEIGGQEILYTVPVVYKWNDPVKGEQYRPFVITPPVFANIAEPVYIFSKTASKEVEVTLKAGKAGVSGNVKLQVPEGWEVSPAEQNYELTAKGEEKKFYFRLTPPDKQSTGAIKAVMQMNGKTYSNSLITVDYEHIPTQLLMPEAEAKVVKINIEKHGELVGYIQGAGDAIPAALREIGYEVWEMKEDEITPENLDKLDAVILGVRALNTNERINFYMNDLLDYVNKGGTLIVQYNTNFRLKTDHFAPYPLELSRDRVADENAEVKILEPRHPAMSTPNKITEKDFEDWVQERGLYFPDQWDKNYTALLSSHDKGEKDKNGGLLVAKYGKGYYIYTGYSWFRELPAGVPGAYRIFVNLVSLGNAESKAEANKP